MKSILPFFPSALALLHENALLDALFSSVRPSELPVLVVIGNAPGGAWLVARVCCFHITEMLLVIGKIFATMERDWQIVTFRIIWVLVRFW